MKKKFIVAFAAFALISSLSFGQESNFIEYQVTKGETISKIARNNKVSVSEILSLNPDYKTGIKEGDIIKIPSNKATQNTLASTKATNEVVNNLSERKSYLVEPKETLFGISKKFNVSVENLYKWNPSLQTDGLKANTIIYLSPEIDAASNYKEIVVESKQTLYALAKGNNVSIEQLISINPELKDGLKVGQTIKIPTSSTTLSLKSTSSTYESKKEMAVSVPTTSTISNGKYMTVTVEPKQTVFSLSKEYAISPEDFLALNPEVRRGLIVGMQIKVPASEITNITSNNAVSNKANTLFSVSYTNFSTSLDKSTTKELALMLPFNVSRLGDNLEERMKVDGFLNMTMDFYLGARLAIDKALSMGLPLVSRVYDSNETKSSSDVKTILNEREFATTDAIIGPFFQSNVDEAIKALPNKDVILFSPLSNEKASPSNQLVQTMPNGDVLKKALLDYFIKSNSTITVIIDPKRISTKQFMQRYYPSIKVIETSAIKDIDKSLSPNKNDVFILDSSSIEAALLLTDKLKGKANSNTITVASFDKNDAFDYSEIKIETLIALNYTFPSVTRDSHSTSDINFIKEFKAQNNVLPNRFATRGYDVTLDIIFRLFQKDGFMATLNSKSTEIENKFSYTRTPEGTIRNTGVYILQYNNDLTVTVLE